MRIAILEPYATGHRMDYVRYILAGLREIPGLRISLVTSTAAIEHPNLISVLRDFADLIDVETIVLDYGAQRWMRALGRFAREQAVIARACNGALRRIAARDRLDLVLLAMAENIGALQLLLRPRLFMGRPWATICFSPYFHIADPGKGLRARLRDQVHRIGLWALLRRRDAVRIFTVVPFLAETVRHPKLTYLKAPSHPWPADSRAAAREHFGVAGEAAVVLVFGSIDWRKDLATLLDGAARVPRDVAIKVLVAGTQVRDDVAAILSGDVARRLAAEGRLVVVDRDIREGTDPNPCIAADIVWVRYHRSFRHQSAVMAKAGQARRPVIARSTGILGWYVKDCGVGLAVESDDAQAIADAIVRLAGDPALRATLGEAGYRTFSGHTPGDFARAIREAVVGALDRARAPAD